MVIEQLKKEAEKEFDEFFQSTKNLKLDIETINIETLKKSTHRENIKKFINSQIEKAEERGRQEMKEEIIEWAEDNRLSYGDDPNVVYLKDLIKKLKEK